MRRKKTKPRKHNPHHLRQALSAPYTERKATAFVYLLLLLLCALFGTASGRDVGVGYKEHSATVANTGSYPTCAGEVIFAVIGDYGDGSADSAAVAGLIDDWGVDFIVTSGDNNYPDGAAETIDEHIGQFFSAYIAPYQGDYGPGAVENAFYPAIGNHDWHNTSLAPYLAYFTLPHNERYYSVVRGPVQIFILDSDPREPDGISADSIQASWLQEQLYASTAVWKIIVLHHPPYSSGVHGSTPALQWPFKAWGATAVISGHDHTYERLQQDGLDYFVNGLGGKSIYDFGTPLPESLVRYNLNYGAMKVTAAPHCLTYQFYNIAHEEIDRLTYFDPNALAHKHFFPTLHHAAQK